MKTKNTKSQPSRLLNKYDAAGVAICFTGLLGLLVASYSESGKNYIFIVCALAAFILSIWILNLLSFRSFSKKLDEGLRHLDAGEHKESLTRFSEADSFLGLAEEGLFLAYPKKTYTPGRLKLLTGMATVKFHQGEYSEAKKEYQKILELPGNNSKTYLALIRCDLKLKNEEAAKKHLAKLTDDYTDSKWKQNITTEITALKEIEEFLIANITKLG